MRRLKRISFFLYSCLLFAVGFYGHYKIEQWFYPGRQAIISQNEIPFFQMQSATQAVSVPDPPLTELQQGLLRMELVSFSPQQIVVSKTYRKLQQAEAFFLQIEENRVIVYEEDSRVLYLQTAIDARTLPSGVRRQILNGWHGVSKAELEKFLVSQTET